MGEEPEKAFDIKSQIVEHVIDEIVNPELILSPLGQMPFTVDTDKPAPDEQVPFQEPEIEAPPKQKPKPPDADRFLMSAKQAVVKNYNQHRDTRRAPKLSLDTVYIVWFSKVLKNWKSIVASPLVKGLLWEVTYNGERHETYVDVYKKINNIKVISGGKTP